MPSTLMIILVVELYLLLMECRCGDKRVLSSHHWSNIGSSSPHRRDCSDIVGRQPHRWWSTTCHHENHFSLHHFCTLILKCLAKIIIRCSIDISTTVPKTFFPFNSQLIVLNYVYKVLLILLCCALSVSHAPFTELSELQSTQTIYFFIFNVTVL